MDNTFEGECDKNISTNVSATSWKYVFIILKNTDVQNC